MQLDAVRNILSIHGKYSSIYFWFKAGEVESTNWSGNAVFWGFLSFKKINKLRFKRKENQQQLSNILSTVVSKKEVFELLKLDNSANCFANAIFYFKV